MKNCYFCKKSFSTNYSGSCEDCNAYHYYDLMNSDKLKFIDLISKTSDLFVTFVFNPILCSEINKRNKLSKNRYAIDCEQLCRFDFFIDINPQNIDQKLKAYIVFI